MEPIKAPKGTQDILPADSGKWQTVERIAREVAELYRFKEIRTPIFEFTDLFHRGVGETTDIVSKETYTFTDRGNRSLTLRPEGTAGVVRAAIESGALNDQGARLKVFYIGPNFRYEKPQKGRYHQHHQFGVEAFGVADGDQDAECIALQMEFYRRCGVKDLALRINSLGDAESKQNYRDALVKFLSPVAGQLSEDSQRRMQSNPLRILDSKDERDLRLIEGAPPSSAFLSEASAKHFARVQTLLNEAGVIYTVDGALVRGFDYYTGVVWEVTAAGLGSQSAIGGGGRYDNLVENLGGRPTPGVGFGSGLERLLIALEEQGIALPSSSKPLVWLMSHGDAARDANWKLLLELRANGIAADMDLTGRAMKKQFSMAEKEGAAYSLVTGEDELKNNTVVFKNFATRDQTTIPRSEAVSRIKGI
jgi:histidyl-tRNA synthetase